MRFEGYDWDTDRGAIKQRGLTVSHRQPPLFLSPWSHRVTWATVAATFLDQLRS